jgi:hypothetical protein
MGNLLRRESFDATDDGGNTLTMIYFDDGIETKLVLTVNKNQGGLARTFKGTRTTFKKVGSIFPAADATPDTIQDFTYTSLAYYGISKGLGQEVIPTIKTPIQLSGGVALEPFQIVALAGPSDPPFFILDIADLPGQPWLCTDTRNRSGVSAAVGFVDRMNRPSL